MLEAHLGERIVYLHSSSAASQALIESTALSNNLAGMMKDGVILLVEQPVAKDATAADKNESSPQD